jgi:hypothetical protein
MLHVNPHLMVICLPLCHLISKVNYPLAANTKQMAITLPDVPSANLTKYFDATFVFIGDSLAAGRAVLVHCGAGCSRSPAIVAAFLMRHQRIGALAAVERLRSVRSSVCPNEGFWRQLCAFEKELGLPRAQQSDPRKPPAINESYGGVASDAVVAGAGGAKVQVESSRHKRDANCAEGKSASGGVRLAHASLSRCIQDSIDSLIPQLAMMFASSIPWVLYQEIVRAALGGSTTSCLSASIIGLCVCPGICEPMLIVNIFS